MRDEKWEGFVNAIRVGAWHDLEMAKRETISLAALRMAENHNYPAPQPTGGAALGAQHRGNRRR
jgi:hypothetical protein